MRQTITRLLTASLLLALPALGQPPGGMGPGEGPGPRFEQLADLLDLTDDQADHWRTAIDAHRKAVQSQGEEMRSLHEQIDAMVATENPDLEALGALTLSLHRGHEAMKASREALESDLASVLSPEQRDQFELLLEARESFGPRGEGFRGQRGDRRPGAQGRRGGGF